MIDGISNNEVYYGDTVLNQTAIVGIPATLVPTDAIADFSVQQTPSAEFGVKGGAAVNIVMKSGTNVAARHRVLLPARQPLRFAELLRRTLRAEARQGRGIPRPSRTTSTAARSAGRWSRTRRSSSGITRASGWMSSRRTMSPCRPTRRWRRRARIAAAGLKTNPIGEALLKFYPTDPSGTQHVNGATVANMNTFSIKIDHQLNTNNLINGRVFYGRSYQSAPAGNSGEIVSPNQPVDLFNSVTDPTTAALAGLVWNSTLSDHTVLEARVGYQPLLEPDRRQQQHRSRVPRASTPGRSTPPTTAFRR